MSRLRDIPGAKQSRTIIPAIFTGDHKLQLSIEMSCTAFIQVMQLVPHQDRHEEQKRSIK
ncbi:hypothetical protein AKJ16_DCAP21934 [Drosera capensis]